MTSRKTNGFSLIELLIVVTVILIIAAIAIPNLLRSKIAANESSAAAGIRTITTAETTYASSWGSGYAVDLKSLGGATPCTASAATACIIDSLMSVAPYTKSGYTYAAAGGTLTGGTFTTFELNASPAAIGVTGQRAFCADQTGLIRFNTSGVPIGTGAGSCGAGGSILVGN